MDVRGSVLAWEFETLRGRCWRTGQGIPRRVEFQRSVDHIRELRQVSYTERAELSEGVRIDMSEFEIYARRCAVESQSQCAHELALDVAAAVGAPTPPVTQVFTARSASAAANVMSLPPGGGMVWDVFEEHPLVVDIHPPSVGAKWSSTEELARYVFSRLNETRKYELLLVYDLEEFVDSNFEFADRSRMRTYGQ